MSSLLDKVYAGIGTTEKAVDWGNHDALPSADRVTFIVSFYAGDERIVTVTADGNIVATLGAAHDLTSAMENLFSLKIAAEITSQFENEDEAREAVTEALSELRSQRTEDLLFSDAD